MMGKEIESQIDNEKMVKRMTKYDKKLKLAKQYGLSKRQLTAFLKNIYLARKVDDAEIAMKKQNKAFFQISGAGHEGIQTVISSILKPSYDYFLPYYRGRALCLGLGVTPYEMMCQANGNSGDTASAGRQMPAHWGNKKLNIISQSSCTGTQFLHACGIAEAGEYLVQLENIGKYQKDISYNHDEIVYVSSGEGTTSQGEFWESLLTASVKKLPVMYVIEDNGYAISVPVKDQTPGGSISKTLKEVPGLKVYEVDGNCPIESYAVVSQAAKRIREKKGPVLIHAHVTRPYSHSLSDDHSMYRSQEELNTEKENDIFYSYPKTLIEAGIITKKEAEKFLEDAGIEAKEAMGKAIETPWPEQEKSLDHLYSDEFNMESDELNLEPKPNSDEQVPMAGAINRVLKQEIQQNPLAVVFGEDVADLSNYDELLEDGLKGKGGVFKVTTGVQKAGVENQVFNSHLAEANIIGRAIGMAIRGLRPIVEIQFFDYIWTAYMQLKNEMATMRYRSGGDYKCPMVIRVPSGGYLRGGAIFHSQSGESFFTHIPGIKVAMPSNAEDAAGLLRTAIKGDDPVLFLEHKHLYYQGYNRAPYPGNEFMIPFGKAKIVRVGSDLTIVTWGALVQKSIEAAKKLEQDGFSVEVIDLRTLAPFDMDSIKISLSKTNRILIAHEEIKTSGFAGEIAARINEECFESLDAPIKRVTAKDSHTPYCPQSEDYILPQIDDVYNEALALLKY